MKAAEIYLRGYTRWVTFEPGFFHHSEEPPEVSYAIKAVMIALYRFIINDFAP